MQRAAPAIGLLLAAVLLAGCSFQPLYGVNSHDDRITSELSYVEIPERRDRLHQLIRNQLLSTMSPAGAQGGDRYRLDFVPRVDNNNLVIEPDGDVSRRLYMLEVEYRLIDNASDKVIHEGKTFSHLSYDRVRSEFANIQTHTDISERASIQVADDIRTRLAGFFASR
jgi:LPS-assembly lipoprotein